jgi:hypothetical protein
VLTSALSPQMGGERAKSLLPRRQSLRPRIGTTGPFALTVRPHAPAKIAAGDDVQAGDHGVTVNSVTLRGQRPKRRRWLATPQQRAVGRRVISLEFNARSILQLPGCRAATAHRQAYPRVAHMRHGAAVLPGPGALSCALTAGFSARENKGPSHDRAHR